MSTDLSLLSLIQAGFIWGCTYAWSNVVLAAVNHIYPHDDSKLFEAKLIYAIILTTIVIVLCYVIKKISDELSSTAKVGINTVKSIGSNILNKAKTMAHLQHPYYPQHKPIESGYIPKFYETEMIP